MANLITPGLVLQVAEAAEDYVITPAEFSEIMGTISSIFIGVFVFGAVGMLMRGFSEGITSFTSEELRHQETMFFNVPEAREHLMSKGFVYTLRPKVRRTGKDVAYYGSYYQKEKIADVWVDFIKEVKDIEELREYVSGSGFEKVEDWWEVAKGSRFLFKVKLLD